tara:strand:- start:1308 stop:1625 length:318 start_codon:yes stop_codon:yes gene_type:complete
MIANELRIGNYLEDDIGNLIKIDRDSLPFIVTKWIKCHHPIPLTEEWLVKFGFSLQSKEMYFNYGMSIWKCNEMFICNKNGMIIKHVHQLQNLYFALTNEELTIK